MFLHKLISFSDLLSDIGRREFSGKLSEEDLQALCKQASEYSDVSPPGPNADLSTQYGYAVLQDVIHPHFESEKILMFHDLLVVLDKDRALHRPILDKLLAHYEMENQPPTFLNSLMVYLLQSQSARKHNRQCLELALESLSQPTFNVELCDQLMLLLPQEITSKTPPALFRVSELYLSYLFTHKQEGRAVEFLSRFDSDRLSLISKSNVITNDDAKRTLARSCYEKQLFKEALAIYDGLPDLLDEDRPRLKGALKSCLYKNPQVKTDAFFSYLCRVELLRELIVEHGCSIAVKIKLLEANKIYLPEHTFNQIMFHLRVDSFAENSTLKSFALVCAPELLSCSNGESMQHFVEVLNAKLDCLKGPGYFEILLPSFWIMGNKCEDPSLFRLLMTVLMRMSPIDLDSSFLHSLSEQNKLMLNVVHKKIVQASIFFFGLFCDSKDSPHIPASSFFKRMLLALQLKTLSVPQCNEVRDDLMAMHTIAGQLLDERFPNSQVRLKDFESMKILLDSTLKVSKF